MNASTTVRPGDTWALVVAVESYPLRPGLDLDGPYPDACDFVRWLRTWKVPAEQISLLVSPLTKNDGLCRDLAAEGVDCGTTGEVNQENLEGALYKLRKRTGMLVVFWSGHGIMTPLGVRRPLFSNYSDEDKHNLNVESFRRHLRTARYAYPPDQVLIFDVCGTRFDELWHRESLPDKLFPVGPEAPRCQQSILFASEDGQAAENVTQERTGLYYSELRAALKAQSTWPPDLGIAHDGVKTRFAELQAQGEQTRSPIRSIWQSSRGSQEETDLTTNPVPPLQRTVAFRPPSPVNVPLSAVIDAATVYGASRWERSARTQSVEGYYPGRAPDVDRQLFLEFLHDILLYDSIVLDDSSVGTIGAEIKELFVKINSRVGFDLLTFKPLTDLKSTDLQRVIRAVCRLVATVAGDAVHRRRILALPLPWYYRSSKHHEWADFLKAASECGLSEDLLPFSIFAYRGVAYAGFTHCLARRERRPIAYVASPGRMAALASILKGEDVQQYDFMRTGYGELLSLLNLPKLGFDFTWMASLPPQELSPLTFLVAEMKPREAIKFVLDLRNSPEARSLRQLWAERLWPTYPNSRSAAIGQAMPTARAIWIDNEPARYILAASRET